MSFKQVHNPLNYILFMCVSFPPSALLFNNVDECFYIINLVPRILLPGGFHYSKPVFAVKLFQKSQIYFFRYSHPEIRARVKPRSERYRRGRRRLLRVQCRGQSKSL